MRQIDLDLTKAMDSDTVDQYELATCKTGTGRDGTP